MTKRVQEYASWIEETIRRTTPLGPNNTWPQNIETQDLTTVLGFVCKTTKTSVTYTDEATNPFRRPKQHRLRRMMLLTPCLAAVFLHRGAFIAPEAYPERIQALFPTTPTPTPYEVSPWVYAARKGASHGPSLEAREARLTVALWHLGLPLEAIDAHLNLTVPAIDRLEQAIRAMLAQDAFFLWALGDDLLPLATTPARLDLLYRTILASETMETGRKQLAGMRDDLYVRAIEARGAPCRPTPRAMSGRTPVFPDYDSKMRWICASPYGLYAQARLKQRTAKTKDIADLFGWADFSLSREEQDALKAHPRSRTDAIARRTADPARPRASKDAG
jgi:hypothetical protein